MQACMHHAHINHEFTTYKTRLLIMLDPSITTKEMHPWQSCACYRHLQWQEGRTLARGNRASTRASSCNQHACTGGSARAFGSKLYFSLFPFRFGLHLPSPCSCFEIEKRTSYFSSFTSLISSLGNFCLISLRAKWCMKRGIYRTRDDNGDLHFLVKMETSYGAQNWYRGF